MNMENKKNSDPKLQWDPLFSFKIKRNFAEDYAIL